MGGGGGGGAGEGGGGEGYEIGWLKHFYSQPTTLGPDATLNTEIHKKSVRITVPKKDNASKRKHKNQINHYDKQRRVLMANSIVCHSK